MAKYYMLIQRHDNGRWGAAFGDFDKEVVKAELQDYRDHGVKRKDLAIIEAEDNTHAIAEAIARFEEKQNAAST